MIDPDVVTIFDRSVDELEEFALFCICAAGKKATSAAAALDRFLKINVSLTSPFQKVKVQQRLFKDKFPIYMKQCGIGCYNSKAKSFLQLANSNINLRTCSVEELDDIHGIGPKTARFFVLHTRPDQKIACLDTHVLHWLRDRGYSNIPKVTPVKKRYLEIEKLFLDICDRHNMSPAFLDLEIWKAYSRKLSYELV